ncbi:unnamed protein product [Adineta steineri]|uniref:Uncharacterized protein n=1 Tax=Adineta steineri TaxID=433720 RepID=A0A814ZLP0_9BILA|nr:unnamed protein product [Adineta steineri]CAF1246633.1 unnamed protein product [Adineta steineri]CAF3564254.1 unnamed protein product [Adineta steineri]CAF3790793.1 unnamed protein product [Adineta steineri]
MNSTNDEYINSLSVWGHQQLILCIISISLSILLVFIIFIVPAAIIIRRTQRRQIQLNLRESQRFIGFM